MHRFAGLLLLVALLGCSSTVDTEAPRVRTHTASRAGPLVHALDVTLERSAPLQIQYSSEGAPTLTVDADAASTHRVLLTRLRANHTYTYRIVGTDATGSFTTEALPADLASVQFTSTGTPTTPLVLLHLYDPNGFRGYAAVDGAGAVVWFYRTVDLPFGATRRGNGNFVFMDKGRGLVEVRTDGTVAAELAQDTVFREQHHDVIATPANTILFIAFDTRTISSGRLKGEAVWEWLPETGQAAQRWTSWNHFSPEVDRGPRFGLEWMHANSLALGPRGNVLMSVHYFNQVISISPDFQNVEWRLGGVNATRTLAEEDRYSGQHTARELASNRLLLFDNGIERGESSRAIEFDLSGATPRPLWQWQPSRRNLAMAVGSARRLVNGNTVIGFGMSAGLAGSTGPIEVYEVNEAGQTVWHLELANASLMYRAEPLGAIGSER